MNEDTIEAVSNTSYIARFAGFETPAPAISRAPRGKYHCTKCGPRTDCEECPICGKRLVIQTGDR